MKACKITPWTTALWRTKLSRTRSSRIAYTATRRTRFSSPSCMFLKKRRTQSNEVNQFEATSRVQALSSRIMASKTYTWRAESWIELWFEIPFLHFLDCRLRMRPHRRGHTAAVVAHTTEVAVPCDVPIQVDDSHGALLSPHNPVPGQLVDQTLA